MSSSGQELCHCISVLQILRSIYTVFISVCRNGSFAPSLSFSIFKISFLLLIWLIHTSSICLSPFFSSCLFIYHPLYHLFLPPSLPLLTLMELNKLTSKIYLKEQFGPIPQMLYRTSFYKTEISKRWLLIIMTLKYMSWIFKNLYVSLNILLKESHFLLLRGNNYKLVIRNLYTRLSLIGPAIRMPRLKSSTTLRKKKGHRATAAPKTPGSWA